MTDVTSSARAAFDFHGVNVILTESSPAALLAALAAFGKTPQAEPAPAPAKPAKPAKPAPKAEQQAPKAEQPAPKAEPAAFDYADLQRAVLKLVGVDKPAAIAACAKFGVKTFKELDASRWPEAFEHVNGLLAAAA